MDKGFGGGSRAAAIFIRHADFGDRFGATNSEISTAAVSLKPTQQVSRIRLAFGCSGRQTHDLRIPGGVHNP